VNILTIHLTACTQELTPRVVWHEIVPDAHRNERALHMCPRCNQPGMGIVRVAPGQPAAGEVLAFCADCQMVVRERGRSQPVQVCPVCSALVDLTLISSTPRILKCSCRSCDWSGLPAHWDPKP